ADVGPAPGGGAEARVGSDFLADPAPDVLVGIESGAVRRHAHQPVIAVPHVVHADPKPLIAPDFQAAAAPPDGGAATRGPAPTPVDLEYAHAEAESHVPPHGCDPVRHRSAGPLAARQREPVQPVGSIGAGG